MLYLSVKHGKPYNVDKSQIHLLNTALRPETSGGHARNLHYATAVALVTSARNYHEIETYFVQAFGAATFPVTNFVVEDGAAVVLTSFNIIYRPWIPMVDTPTIGDMLFRCHIFIRSNDPAVPIVIKWTTQVGETVLFNSKHDPGETILLYDVLDVEQN